MAKTMPPKRRPRQVHWLVPASMAGSLLCGTLFAVGHHLLYAQLAGTSPPTSSYNVLGSSVSRQEFNLAVGTTFAFLVRACLVFGVSLAYIQLAWAAVKRSNRELTVEDMDTMLGAIRNLIAMGDMIAWWRWPLVLLAAAVAWLIPLATLVPPATLSIGHTSPPSRLLDVPSIAWSSANLVSKLTAGSLNPPPVSFGDGVVATDRYMYAGPSGAVTAIAKTLFAQGGMLPVTPPGQDAHWNVSFFGPSLDCHDASESISASIIFNMAFHLAEVCVVWKYPGERQIMWTNNTGAGDVPSFLAWSPNINDTETGFSIGPQKPPLPPYITMGPWGNESSYFMFKGSGYNYQNAYGGQVPLYLASVPGVKKLKLTNSWGPENLASFVSRDITVDEVADEYIRPGFNLLQCDLHNSTYDVKFTFVDGRQTVDSTVTKVIPEPFAAWVGDVYGIVGSNFTLDLPSGDGGPDAPRLSYAPGCVGLWNPAKARNTTCDVDTSIFAAMSYQAVYDAFKNQILGYDAGWNYGSVTTQINTTIFADSSDIRDVLQDSSYQNATMQDFLVAGRYPLQKGFYKSPQYTDIPLKEGLEQLFQNFTLSLMSSQSLQPNESSPVLPPRSEVTFTNLINIYEYSLERLWLAYGLAIGISALVITGGWVMIYLNSASYNNDFSTFLRLSRGAHLSRKLVETDYDGKDPLPKYLGKAKITFAFQNGSQSSGPKAGDGDPRDDSGGETEALNQDGEMNHPDNGASSGFGGSSESRAHFDVDTGSEAASGLTNN